MESTLEDEDLAFGDPIDEPVFSVDSSGPTTGKVVLEGLRFADPVERR
jgi:hypothetical protein